MPIGLKAFEASVQAIRHERLNSLYQLKRLKATHSNEIEFFCAHDPVELDRYQNM